MPVVALTSCRSSPGVTATAVALTAVWRYQGVQSRLIEADPSGGVLALRFGLAKDPSFARLDTALQTARSQDPGRAPELGEILSAHCVELWGGPCLTAPTDPVIAARAIERCTAEVADVISNDQAHTILDIGRLYPASPSLALADAADIVLFLCRPRVEEVQAVLYGARLIGSARSKIGVVLVGVDPFHHEDVAEVLGGIPVVAVLPDQPAIAGAFVGGRFRPSQLRRSSLWRTVADLATLIDGQFAVTEGNGIE